ncbi:hypothetical protein ACOMHN_034993 [Nucella lapillus]
MMSTVTCLWVPDFARNPYNRFRPTWDRNPTRYRKIEETGRCEADVKKHLSTLNTRQTGSREKRQKRSLFRDKSTFLYRSESIPFMLQTFIVKTAYIASPRIEDFHCTGGFQGRRPPRQQATLSDWAADDTLEQSRCARRCRCSRR